MGEEPGAGGGGSAYVLHLAMDEGVDDLAEGGVGAPADDEDAHEQDEDVEEVPEDRYATQRTVRLPAPGPVQEGRDQECQRTRRHGAHQRDEETQSRHQLRQQDCGAETLLAAETLNGKAYELEWAMSRLDRDRYVSYYWLRDSEATGSEKEKPFVYLFVRLPVYLCVYNITQERVEIQSCAL